MTTNAIPADPYARPENYIPPQSADELLARYAAGERYFRNAKLNEANLNEANLNEANLNEADLNRANLNRADLSGANLSGASGLFSSKEWLENNFDVDELGLIVFKAIGSTYYLSPEKWVFEPGAFLTETLNSCRTTECGSGVNFGTLAFIRSDDKLCNSTIWRCRIRWLDLADVVVPYNTDGKARCACLELIEVVS